MPRPKGSTNKKPSVKEIETPKVMTLSEQPHQNVESMKMSIPGANSWGPVVNGYIQQHGGTTGYYGYDPYIQNQRLKSLKTAPAFPERSDLESALANPGMNELTLRSMSWSLTATSYPYYKMMRLYSDILLYRYYAFPKYIDKKEFKTARFKAEQDYVHRWLDKFDPERTFRRITMETLIEGKRAYAYRQSLDTKNKKVDYATLQELPSNWWKPTYKSTDSYFGVSFNFAYFWTPGTSPDQFPPIFRKLYNEMMGFTRIERGTVKIDFDKVDTKRFEIEKSASVWYVWAELPASEVWCFSADESHSWQVPPFLGLFLSFQDLGSYQFLQTQLASIPLYGILSGEIDLHDDARGSQSQQVDDLRLSPAMISMLEAQATALMPPGTSPIFAPIKNFKFHQFQEQVNSSKIYTEALQQVIATSGLTGLQSTSEKPTVAMVNASKSVEKRFADIFYPQFMKFVDTIFEKKMDFKYEWKFQIFGDVFTEKETVESLQKQIAVGQSYLLPKLLAYQKLDMSSVDDVADWVKASGIYDRMLMPPTAMSGAIAKDDNKPKGGRPEIDEGEIDNDNTASNKDLGINKGEDHVFTVSDISDEMAENILHMIAEAGYEVEM